ncbi:hypothetical protein TIFTF001_033132 [Ficus carica]|uniref:Uncharacterized protein n=1 Tax=Ficus carica TaxID=3494 RepID=A0AA88DXM3_FICCA|nr:hypothetical protein TIFTF001_033132 [Ficus carica]
MPMAKCLNNLPWCTSEWISHAEARLLSQGISQLHGTDEGGAQHRWWGMGEGGGDSSITGAREISRATLLDLGVVVGKQELETLNLIPPQSLSY